MARRLLDQDLQVRGAETLSCRQVGAQLRVLGAVEAAQVLFQRRQVNQLAGDEAGMRQG